MQVVKTFFFLVGHVNKSEHCQTWGSLQTSCAAATLCLGLDDTKSDISTVSLIIRVINTFTPSIKLKMNSAQTT